MAQKGMPPRLPEDGILFALTFMSRKWFHGQFKPSEAPTIARMLFTIYQWRVNGLLASKAEVARLLSIEHKTTLNHYIGRLVEAGYVKLTPSKTDRRRSLIVLTSEGDVAVEDEATRIVEEIDWIMAMRREAYSDAHAIRPDLTDNGISPFPGGDVIVPVKEWFRSYGGRLPETVARRMEDRTPREQIEIYSETIEHDKTPMALACRAKVFARIGDFNKAIVDLNAAIAIDPASDLFVDRAQIFREMGDLKNSRKDIEHALKISPDSFDALYARAFDLFEAQKYEESLQIYNRLLDQRPNESHILVQRAMLLDRMGRSRDALKELDRAYEAISYWDQALKPRIETAKYSIQKRLSQKARKKK